MSHGILCPDCGMRLDDDLACPRGHGEMMWVDPEEAETLRADREADRRWDEQQRMREALDLLGFEPVRYGVFIISRETTPIISASGGHRGSGE